MKVVRKESGGDMDATYLERLAEEYRRSKETLDAIEKRTNAIKKELSEAVDTFGDEDEKGHKWLKVGDTTLKRERRVSVSFDAKNAEEWARENGHWDNVKEVVEVLSEDKLLGLAWDDKALDEVVRGFYVEKETWAFKA